jgi:hypothetical protein
LNFKVVSLSNEPFDAVVMTQEMLDTSDNIEYQKAEGQISGQIKNDNGVYSNYFLILKSDKPLEVEVVSEIQEIPLVSTPSTPQDLEQQQQQQYQLQQQPQKKKKMKENFEMSFTNKLLIFFGVFLLLCAGYGLYLYFRKPTSPVVEALPPPPAVLDIKEVTDGLNSLGVKLDEVTTGVSNLSKIEHNISENLQELKGKIPDNIISANELNDLKNSLNDMKPNWEQFISHQPTPLVPSSPLSLSSAVDNAEEILTKLNSYKIINNNKQA